MEEAASPALTPSLRLMVGRTVVIGPGKAQLLDLIRETGSIAAAGRRMGMSYKRAWSLVATMNRSFREPLVSVSRGGSEHGGAAVTAIGESVLAAYRRLLAGIDAGTDTAFIRGALAFGAGQDGAADEG